MDKHVQLGYELMEVTGLKAERIHWQPDANVTLKYPCVLYNANAPKLHRADDKSYIKHERYLVTYIYKSTDNGKVDEFLNHFEYITPEDPQVVDGLYHEYYTIYY